MSQTMVLAPVPPSQRAVYGAGAVIDQFRGGERLGTFRVLGQLVREDGSLELEVVPL